MSSCMSSLVRGSLVMVYGELIRAVMAMRVSKSNSFALTVSADHLVGRYDLKARIVTFWSGPIHPDYHDRTSL